MIRKDLWLDTPVNIEGGNTTYGEVIHIDTIQEGCEYVEDVYGEILYLDEMDKEMREDALALL